jgi:alpha-L-rhamnosidase
MLANGATTMWEGWGVVERLEEDGELTSRNHSPSTVISEWFYESLAGIRVGEPGFEHVRIGPKPTGDLEWAGGHVETVRGLVESSWKLTETPGEGREGHGIALDVTVPGNATATVEIPRLGADNVRVREGGTNV